MKYVKIKKRPADSHISISVYLSPKKKNRGLKRLIKPIELWRKNNLILDIDELENTKRRYIKLSFSYFYNLFKSKNPPIWYQKLLMKALYDIYSSWFVELSKLSKPFYLKMWLMKDDLMLSQIVVAIDDGIDIYSSIFEENPINSESSLNSMLNKFPFLENLFIIPLLHLSSLNSLDDNLSPKEIKKLNKISTKKIEKDDGSTTFIYPSDTVLFCSL